MFNNPYVRLVGRALSAGVVAALTQIHTAPDGTLAWRSAVTGGALAALELLTPLNKVVGLGKGATT